MPRALISVHDKTRIVGFAQTLADLGWEILASGGTVRALAEAGVAAVDIATVTGYPAILGHRVVTLHPQVHGAILADIDDPNHRTDLADHGITPIDLVVVGLYPFAEYPSIDLIDVGGPAMIRAAAKNHRHVGVVTDERQYDAVLAELSSTGRLSDDTRLQLAREAFASTAAYDAAIASWFAGDDPLPGRITLSLAKDVDLRYGENPHQTAAHYVVDGTEAWWKSVQQLGGKEMSYLNVLDAQAAADLVWRFDEPAAVIIKHANPCGVAIGSTVTEAHTRALACDPVSAFGGIVGVNNTIDEHAARSIADTFTEVVIAPSYTQGALEILAAAPNLRILRAGRPPAERRHIRQINGGFLVQTIDPTAIDTSSWRVVTTATPTEDQLRDARLAWTTCVAVWSNAIVLAADGATVAIAGGQASRVDAVDLACRRAGMRARGAVAASDAFFPFPDGPSRLVEAGIGLIVQPGGSVRDAESIAVAEAAGCAMVFTGRRLFRH
jgi:phosphoribosylaminoimidazolecarboxamide formyltransferase/IMP cyclohydrolase